MSQYAQYLNTLRLLCIISGVTLVQCDWALGMILFYMFTLYNMFTLYIILEYSYTFLYYQHWCDLGAV